MTKRNLDGIYFRVNRNGYYENICFSDLIEEERDEICTDRPASWYKAVAYHLAERLRTIGDEFEIEGR